MQNKKLKTFLSLLAAVFIFCGLAAAVSVKAEWKKDGVEINKGNLDVPRSWEDRETVISDKSGVIFVYTVNKNYYIQKINVQGEKMWKEKVSGKKGIFISKATASTNHTIVPDGFGGVIVSFNVHNLIYAQRINKWGEPQWWEGARVKIREAKKGSNPAPIMVPDKKGGAIIGWHDDLDASGGIYVARIDYKGNILWEKSGKELFKDRSQGDIKMVLDKKGYIYISNQGAYLQKINRNGQFLWSAAGIEIMPNFKEVSDYKMIYNNKDGIIFVGRRDQDYKTVAQKVDFNGKLKWSKNGIAVSGFGSGVWHYDIVPDGNGGVIIAWEDERVDRYGDIYAQKINKHGKKVWGKEDKAITATPYEEDYPMIILGNKKEVIISWNSNFQKINRQGKLQWGNEGIELSLNEVIIRKVNNTFVVLGDPKWPKEGIYAYKINQNGNILGD